MYTVGFQEENTAGKRESQGKDVSAAAAGSWLINHVSISLRYYT